MSPQFSKMVAATRLATLLYWVRSQLPFARVKLTAFFLVIILAPAAQASTATGPKAPASQSPTIPIAVQPVSPFTIQGFLQRATIVAGGDPVSGGTLEVNGHSIKVTTNTMVVMPGTLLRWQSLFTSAPAPWGPAQTGMALLDSPKPPTTYEVLVQGNRIIGPGGDNYIAGLIFIWQQSLNSGQGFVNFIDYQAGELRVGGVLNDPATGARVRLNDPLGRYGRAMSPDQRFTIDEANPTVRTATGYPMCIPRVNVASASANHPVTDDPLCPQVNRPRDSSGALLRQFTLPPPPCSSLAAPQSPPASADFGTCTQNPAPGAPDATKQMPFEVGDWVTFQGSLERDTTPACGRRGSSLGQTDCQYISAWSVIASIGAFTAPGTMPAYVAIDLAQIGTGGVANPGVPQEASANVRIEGFTTDPTQPIDIYGVDVDPCTGAGTDRYWGTQPAQQIGPLGRFRFTPIGGTFTPAVREVRAVSQTLSQGATPANIAAAQTFANGIIAGQYDAPVTKFIFPESAEAGLAMIPLNFQDFPFLAAGFLPSKCTASLSPASLNFSKQAPGTTSPPQQVTLTNTGVGALDISKVTISDSFTQTNNCGLELASGASCNFSVTFTAGRAFIQTGVLRINDTATGSPQTVSLLGSTGQPARVSFAPLQLDFPDRAPGTTSPRQMVTVSNSGGADLKIGNIAVSSGYKKDTNCGLWLKHGATCAVWVKFRPTAVGVQRGSLEIEDDAVGSPHTLQLVGSSSDFELSTQHATGVVSAAAPATYTLNLTGTPAFSGDVRLTCSNLPPATTCSFAPEVVALNGTSTQTAVLTIRRIPVLRAGTLPWKRLPLAICLLGGAVLTCGRRRRINQGVAALMLIALISTGCGAIRDTQFTSAAVGGVQHVRITASSANGALHELDLVLDLAGKR